MENREQIAGISRKDEEAYLEKTLRVVGGNMQNYEVEITRMQAEIDEMLGHYHDNDVELYTALNNTITMCDSMKRAYERNKKAMGKPYFGRIVFHDETLDKEESLYIGRGGISIDTTHQIVVDWRAPVSNAYYENGLGKCSYPSPEGKELPIDLKLKRTFEIEGGKLLDFFDTEVIANDELLTKYLAKSKQAVLGEIIATIQKEQNEIIRKSPYHNLIVQGVAGSGKTTVAMHRISFILYNYAERFKPDDFYIVGSNRILLEYITGVLPDLDVYGIRQMTMEQLFTRLLYEDWDEKKYRIAENGRSGAENGVRGTYQWFRELQAFCEELEKKSISTETVYLNPKQFVEGIRNGVAGVFDETEGGRIKIGQKIVLLSGKDIEDYLSQNRTLSIQTKINMLNERLLIRVKDEFLRRGLSYTEKERKAILKAYRNRYGKKEWKYSVYSMYKDFLSEQREKGYAVTLPDKELDVYDLAALAYLYKRVRETEVISEAHHVVIDEAQDFGMMAYAVLKACIRDCTYTIMGDVSQNIHFGYGLNDWRQLQELMLSGERSSFEILSKSYRNTVEISEFAMNILGHGRFETYPIEPIIRHGDPVSVKLVDPEKGLYQEAADICREWQKKGLDTIAVVCRTTESAQKTAKWLGKLLPVAESDPEKAVFTDGVMVLPVAYTKGLEFDAVLILNPDERDYPKDDEHAKLLYVAATRALHELCVLHTGKLSGLIAETAPKREAPRESLRGEEAAQRGKEDPAQEKASAPDRQEAGAEKQLQAMKPPAREVTPRKKLTATLRKPKAAAAPPPTILLSGTRGYLEQVRKREEEKAESARLQEAKAKAAREARRRKLEGVGPVFGDKPSTEMLRPAGHARADLAVKWVMKKPDGLYLQSRYGILRISPLVGGMVRVTFGKEGEIPDQPVKAPGCVKPDPAWMYREKGGYVEIQTEFLKLQINKALGGIRYLTGDGKLLLAERETESRLIEKDLTAGGAKKVWVFFDWKKERGLSAPGIPGTEKERGKEGFSLKGGASYIQPKAGQKELPTVVSERGYCIQMATDHPVICCDIPAYGSYLSAEGESVLDFFFCVIKR